MRYQKRSVSPIQCDELRIIDARAEIGGEIAFRADHAQLVPSQWPCSHQIEIPWSVCRVRVAKTELSAAKRQEQLALFTIQILQVDPSLPFDMSLGGQGLPGLGLKSHGEPLR